MALPPLATVNALEEWLGLEADSLAGADAARAGAYLSAASALVRSVTRRAWVEDGDALDSAEPTLTEDDVEVARFAVIQAAARKWQNPTGAVQETKGPFSSTYAAAAALGIYLTDVDEATLLPFHAKGATPALFTISTTRDAPGLDTTYIEVDPEGKPIPFLGDIDPLYRP